MSENGEIYTAGNKFYTPAGTDGMDKFHLCYYNITWGRGLPNLLQYYIGRGGVYRDPKWTVPYET